MKNNTVKTDLADSEDDQKHMEPEEVTLDLPDVKDIPGQEHVRPLPQGEMADTTISSSDEEGEGLFDDDDEDDDLESEESNVTPEEKELLRRTSESLSSDEDEDVRNALVDSTDAEGEPLNEKSRRSGKDLDVPGSEEDDANEEIGEEDEENNSYSIPDQGS